MFRRARRARLAKDPAKQLESELGGPVAGLEPLDDEELRRLVEAIRAARRRQSRALERAAEDSLRYVPRLLRGAAKRLLYG